MTKVAQLVDETKMSFERKNGVVMKEKHFGNISERKNNMKYNNVYGIKDPEGIVH